MRLERIKTYTVRNLNFDSSLDISQQFAVEVHLDVELLDLTAELNNQKCRTRSV